MLIEFKFKLTYSDNFNRIKIREDLMNKEFPSIWMEIREENEPNKLIKMVQD